MPRQLSTNPNNIRVREAMKKCYYEQDGKVKGLIKNYKRKYRDDEYIMHIINKDMELYEKVKAIKTQIFLNDMQKWDKIMADMAERKAQEQAHTQSPVVEVAIPPE